MARLHDTLLCLFICGSVWKLHKRAWFHVLEEWLSLVWQFVKRGIVRGKRISVLLVNNSPFNRFSTHIFKSCNILPSRGSHFSCSHLWQLGKQSHTWHYSLIPAKRDLLNCFDQKYFSFHLHNDNNSHKNLMENVNFKVATYLK